MVNITIKRVEESIQNGYNGRMRGVFPLKETIMRKRFYKFQGTITLTFNAHDFLYEDGYFRHYHYKIRFSFFIRVKQFFKFPWTAHVSNKTKLKGNDIKRKNIYTQHQPQMVNFLRDKNEEIGLEKMSLTGLIENKRERRKVAGHQAD